MIETTTLDHLLTRCGHLAPHEAVALVQQLLATHSETGDNAEGTEKAAGTAEEVVLHAQNVTLHANGAVGYRGGPPSIQGLGCLLDTMLACSNGVRVPGALRFTVARACGSVEAPPYPSRSALSAALDRFEHGAREDVLRQLLMRIGLVPVAPASVNVSTPDRRSSVSASALRRELREADERLFALLQASAAAPAPSEDDHAATPSRARWAAVALAAVIGSFAAGYAATELLTKPTDQSVEQTSPVRSAVDQSTRRGGTPSVPSGGNGP